MCFYPSGVQSLVYSVFLDLEFTYPNTFERLPSPPMLHVCGSYLAAQPVFICFPTFIFVRKTFHVIYLKNY